MIDWLGWTLVIICVILVVLPPKWGPAFRSKKWVEQNDEKE